MSVKDNDYHTAYSYLKFAALQQGQELTMAYDLLEHEGGTTR